MATTNSLLIGKYIYKILSENDDLKNKVGNKIYPIVIEQGTQYPFIIFTKSNVNSSYSKDGIIKDYVTIEIHVVTTTYIEGCEIANIARNLFDCTTYKDDEITIYNSKLTNVSEGFQDDAYVQTLIFELQVK